MCVWVHGLGQGYRGSNAKRRGKVNTMKLGGWAPCACSAAQFAADERPLQAGSCRGSLTSNLATPLSAYFLMWWQISSLICFFQLSYEPLRNASRSHAWNTCFHFRQFESKTVSSQKQHFRVGTRHYTDTCKTNYTRVEKLGMAVFTFSEFLPRFEKIGTFCSPRRPVAANAPVREIEIPRVIWMLRGRGV